MLEMKHYEAGHRYIFGIDEAGRGPMAGPLVAGAVCLPLDDPELETRLKGVKDSKQMTPLQRERAAELIQEVAIAWGTGEVTADEMPLIGNMTRVTLIAMQRALEAAQARATIQADFLMIDYYNLPTFDSGRQEALTKGDTLSLSIAAASVLAKVERDKQMIDYAAQYPEYGFEKHKGYPTPQHRSALKRLGITPIHRRNYAPVQRILAGFLD